jgi:hypothetical protein
LKQERLLSPSLQLASNVDDLYNSRDINQNAKNEKRNAAMITLAGKGNSTFFGYGEEELDINCCILN